MQFIGDELGKGAGVLLNVCEKVGQMPANDGHGIVGLGVAGM